MAVSLFIVGVVVLFFGAISFIVPNLDLIRGPAFFISWLTTELAVQLLILNLATAVVLLALGGYQQTIGIVGAVLILLNSSILLYHILNSLKAEKILEDALEDSFKNSALLPQGADVRQIYRVNLKKANKGRVFPFPIRPSKVKKIKNVPYIDDGNRRHKLDIYVPKVFTVEGSEKEGEVSIFKPVVVMIHGGAWVIGQKENQGLPHIHTLTKNGYICVAINYRLSPKATWPDHILDVKHALSWVKENIKSYGGDPKRVAVAGMSAGGHLAVLSALSVNDARYQPGFETFDTNINACIGIYPVLDLTNTLKVQTNQLIGMLTKLVFKTSLRTDRESWEYASPLLKKLDGSPPMFILHGSKDLLVPIEESIEFVRRSKVAKNLICFANLTGAQHAFEIFWSIRARKSVAAVMTFLDVLFKNGDLSS